MGAQVTEGGVPVKFTTSAVMRTGGTNLLGLFVSGASSTPTIEVLNAVTSGTGTAFAVFTPVAGTFYPMPASLATGLTILTSGSVTGTAIFSPT